MVSGKNFSWDNVQDHQLFGGKTPWFPIDFPSNHSIEYTVDEYIYIIYIPIIPYVGYEDPYFIHNPSHVTVDQGRLRQEFQESLGFL